MLLSLLLESFTVSLSAMMWVVSNEALVGTETLKCLREKEPIPRLPCYHQRNCSSPWAAILLYFCFINSYYVFWSAVNHNRKQTCARSHVAKSLITQTYKDIFLSGWEAFCLLVFQIFLPDMQKPCTHSLKSCVHMVMTWSERHREVFEGTASKWHQSG